MYVYVYMCVYVFVYFVYVHVYMYMCEYVCVCVCIILNFQWWGQTMKMDSTEVSMAWFVRFWLVPADEIVLLVFGKMMFGNFQLGVQIVDSPSEHFILCHI